MKWELIYETLGKIKKIFIYCLLAFIVLGFIAGLVFKGKVDVISKMVSEFVSSKSHILGTTGFSMAVELLKNNFKASALSMALGLVPFLFLPVFTMALNAAILGGFYHFAIMMPGFTSLTYMVSILPHGILEIPAILIATAVGIKFCLELTKTIMKKPHDDLVELLQGGVGVLLVVVLPMLVVAALIEAFITPSLILWMMD